MNNTTKKSAAATILFILSFILILFNFSSYETPAITQTQSLQIRDINNIRIVKQHGQSALLDADGKAVLILQGTYYQMGYAYGKLMQDQVKPLIDSILQFAETGDVDPKLRKIPSVDILEEIYTRSWPYMPSCYKEELKGFADGAGVDFHKLVLANLLPELFHCSGYVFMNKATKDGKLIHVRVLDYPTNIGLQNHSVVIIQRPIGANTTMTAGFAGFIGAVTGLNDKGLAVGQIGVNGVGDWDGRPMTIMLKQILETSDNLEEMVNYLRREARTCHHAYIFSDAKAPSAIAIEATPTIFDLLRPGETHPKLPNPLPDCLLVSERHKLLSELTEKHYGRIDVETAIEITKYIAMDCNLHNAIMLPEDGVMYLAVAADPSRPNYQACYQPYYKYELARFLPIADKLSQNKINEPEHVALSEIETERQKPKEVVKEKETIIGIVPAAYYVRIQKDSNPEVSRLLELYEEKDPQDFRFKLEKAKSTEYYDAYNLTFPSPYKSKYAKNNTVWGQYFRPKKNIKNYAIIFLHPATNDFSIPLMICHMLASSGFDTFMIHMSYYGNRRPEGIRDVRELIESNGPDFLVKSVIQTVMDVRRTALIIRTLTGYNQQQIGLCGVSLGALVSSLLIGVDPHFNKAAIVMGGANIVKLIEVNSKELSAVIEYMDRYNLTFDDLRKILYPIEPLTYIHRAKSAKVLAITAKADQIIPSECFNSLVSNLNSPKIVEYDANHISMFWYMADAMQKVISFFSQHN